MAGTVWNGRWAGQPRPGPRAYADDDAPWMDDNWAADELSRGRNWVSGGGGQRVLDSGPSRGSGFGNDTAGAYYYEGGGYDAGYENAD